MHTTGPNDIEIGVHKEYLSTGATTSAVVWTPATGKRIVLTDCDVLPSAAGATSVFFDSDAAPAAETTLNSDGKGTSGRVMKGDFAVNGGITKAMNMPRRGPLDGVLRVTMPATGCYLYVSGYEEQARVSSGA